MPPEPPQTVRFTARAPRGAFGQAVKWAFWIFQILMLAAALGNCSLVLPYLDSEDPEVAMGAGMFATLLGMSVFLLWPLGTVVLGALMWLTRGRKLVLEAPPR